MLQFSDHLGLLGQIYPRAKNSAQGAPGGHQSGTVERDVYLNEASRQDKINGAREKYFAGQ